VAEKDLDDGTGGAEGGRRLAADQQGMEAVNVMDSTIDPRALLTTPNLVEVGVAGDAVRRAMHGKRTTFVRVFEIHVDAPPSSAPAELAAGEIRIVGNPASEEIALRAVTAAAALAGGVAVTGFSLAELFSLAGDVDRLRSLAAQLRAAGLEAVAECPVDAELADLAGAVLATRAGGLVVQRLTVSQQPAGERRLPGVIDAASGASSLDVDGRLALVDKASQLQDRVGGFRVFAPLARTLSVAGPTTGYADIKQIALARTVVRNIDSIQVDWPLYGPKLAQVALTTGADDVDGIAAIDTNALGWRRTALEEIKNNIRAAGLEAFERDARFGTLAPVA
jgi:hypothetical protein